MQYVRAVFQSTGTMSLPPATSSAVPEGLLHPEPMSRPNGDHHVSFLLPKLRLEIRDLKDQAIVRALSAVNFSECLTECTQNVLRHLYLHPEEASTNVPPTRSVTLILRDMEGVAYTTGSELDNDHKEIHFSTRHMGNTKAENLRSELYGVVTHELVHCFQYNGLHSCNGGLIEGIADWVRLRCGHVPPHWSPKTEDKTWDAGYETTGYFLDFLERQCGEGTVRRINEKLRLERYEEKTFWPELLDDTVENLWCIYAASLAK